MGRVVRPDTTPADLPVTDHPQEDQIDSLENQVISSSQKSSSKKIYIPPGVYNENKAEDGYDTYVQIGPFLGAMEIEGTQIFDEEEAKPPVAVAVQTNFKSSMRMVLELAAFSGASVLAPLVKQSIDWVKEDLNIRCQPAKGNKKLLLERLKDKMNRKLVRYSTLDEAKANSKSKKKKNW